MGIDGEKSEANSDELFADIKGLTIQSEQVDGILVLKLDGRVDGSNALQSQKAVGAFWDQVLTGLVVDLEQLTYISSAGLRVILLTAQQLQRNDVKFAVCSLLDSIGEVFQISDSDKIISTQATRDRALSEFGECWVKKSLLKYIQRSHKGLRHGDQTQARLFLT